jgi:hypothetical protein
MPRGLTWAARARFAATTGPATSLCRRPLSLKRHLGREMAFVEPTGIEPVTF